MTRLRVRTEMCETCIFRPGNLMHLRRGRLADLLEECKRRDSHVACHETLECVTGERDGEAVCRGFIDSGRTSQVLQVAERLGLIEEVR